MCIRDRRLRHQARLQAHVAVAHLAVELGLGNQRGDGIDNENIDGTGADQGFRNFQSLFAGVGLRNQQIVDIDAQLLSVPGIKCVFGVDKRRQTAGLLRFGDDLDVYKRQGDCRCPSPSPACH